MCYCTWRELASEALYFNQPMSAVYNSGLVTSPHTQLELEYCAPSTMPSENEINTCEERAEMKSSSKRWIGIRQDIAAEADPGARDKEALAMKSKKSIEN